MLQSFALLAACCPSEHNKAIFIKTLQNIARTFGGIPHPNSSKQIDQFPRYELVECGAGVKYLENIPLSLSLWLSTLDMAPSEKCQCWVAVRCLADGIDQFTVEFRCSRNYSEFDQLIVYASRITQQLSEEV